MDFFLFGDALCGRETTGKTWQKRKRAGEKEWESLAGNRAGKRKNSVVMPTVALGIDFECDII
jgi:hypothetical protein